MKGENRRKKCVRSNAFDKSSIQFATITSTTDLSCVIDMMICHSVIFVPNYLILSESSAHRPPILNVVFSGESSFHQSNLKSTSVKIHATSLFIIPARSCPIALGHARYAQRSCSPSSRMLSVPCSHYIHERASLKFFRTSNTVFLVRTEILFRRSSM